MTYEVYRYIFIGASILCGIMLIASVLIFIFLKIPKIIGNLTGSTAKKAIQDIAEKNNNVGNAVYKSNTHNGERGKLTDKISSSGTVINNIQHQMEGIPTSKISTPQNINQDTEDATMALGLGTTVLSSDTTVLTYNSNQTTLLNSGNGYEMTDVLSNSSVEVFFDPSFAIENDITFIHTDEMIK